MTASTRRAALGAIFATPLASVTAVALTGEIASDLPDHEARFLALAPAPLPKLVEYDRLWAESTELYSVAERAHPHPDPRVFDLDALKESARRLVAAPEWIAYLDARRPADDLDSDIDETVAPFMDLAMVSLSAILLKYRIGMTLPQYEDDAISDLSRLAKEVLCA